MSDAAPPDADGPAPDAAPDRARAGATPAPAAATASRRAVLAALLTGGAVVAVGGVAYLVVRADDAGPGGTTTDDALEAVGRRYLRDHPDEADPAVLLEALAPLGGTAPADPETELAVLREQVAEDFASGETVDVDGWILSRTEARAAALHSLTT